MNARLVFYARSGLLASMAGLLLAGPTSSNAQQESQGPDASAPGVAGVSAPGGTRNPRAIAQSAVQRELEAIYARQGKHQMRPMTQQAAMREIEQTTVASDGRTVVRSAERKTIRPKPASRSRFSVLKKVWKPLGEIFESTPTRSLRTVARRPSAGPAQSSRRTISPSVTSPAPRRSVVRQTSGKVLPVPASKSAAPRTKTSDIQRELQKLYERDGRQMPSMNISDLPKTPADAKQAAASRDLTKSNLTVQRRENRAVGFLKKLLPFSKRKEKVQPRKPVGIPQYHAPSTSHRPPAGSGPTDAKKSPKLLPDFLTRRRATQSTAADKPVQPQPMARHTPPAPAPPVEETIGPQPVAETEDGPQPMPEPTMTAENDLDDLENAFPDGAEVEADRDGSPLTGLNLDENKLDEETFPAPAKAEIPDEQFPAPIKPDVQAVEVPQVPDTDSESVEIPQRGGTETENAEVIGKPDVDSELIVIPQRRDAAAKNAEVAADEKPAAPNGPGDKMKRIVERNGQDGLKGFCPVVLRDQRDLTDAKPDFASSFAENTYHFSSAKAKEKFDENPAKYAPVAGGHDVVLLLNSGNLVEGSLDYAVWYRNRLYMFNGRKSLQDFVLEPAKHAVEAKE